MCILIFQFILLQITLTFWYCCFFSLIIISALVITIINVFIFMTFLLIMLLPLLLLLLLVLLLFLFFLSLLFCYSLHENCTYSESFMSVFSRIRTKYGEILSISPYSLRMQENADQETPNTDTFHAVIISLLLLLLLFSSLILLLFSLLSSAARILYSVSTTWCWVGTGQLYLLKMC